MSDFFAMVLPEASAAERHEQMQNNNNNIYIHREVFSLMPVRDLVLCLVFAYPSVPSSAYQHIPTRFSILGIITYYLQYNFCTNYMTRTTNRSFFYITIDNKIILDSKVYSKWPVTFSTKRKLCQLLGKKCTRLQFYFGCRRRMICT